jgi:hypothetical protein
LGSFGIWQDYPVADQSNIRFVASYRLLRRERGDNLLKARIAAQWIPAWMQT